MPGVLAVWGERIEHWFCEQHGQMWAQVERDLPLAIQELHALALLFPDAMRVEYLQPPPHQIHVAEAYERVRRLRALEAELKGD